MSSQPFQLPRIDVPFELRILRTYWADLPKNCAGQYYEIHLAPEGLAIESISERNKYDVELWEHVARLKDEAVVVEK